MTKRAAVFSVDFDVVAAMILGSNARCRMARQSFDAFGHPFFDLIIEHPDLPVVEEGLMLPRKSALATLHADGRITYSVQEGGRE